MAGMMKVAGAFSKTAREPMRSTVMVKGDRMATVSGDRISVIDLNKETFTDIDLKNKTYAVITFADMMRAMAKMSEKVKGNEAQLSFKADVKNTGATRTINGLNTKQAILTLTMEGTDKDSGKTGGMQITTDMWITPSMPGYDEVRNFSLRMAQKLNWTPNSGFLSAMVAQQSGMSKGMAEVVKEMSKLDGIPVLQVVRMGASGTGVPSEAEIEAQRQSATTQQEPAPTVSDAAGTAAAGVATSRTGRVGAIAGGLGGFGRFGRRKQQEQQPQQQPPAEQPQAQATPTQGGSPASSGTLMELTTELTSFSSGSVDGGKFEIPAGFKQVDHDMQKALR